MNEKSSSPPRLTTMAAEWPEPLDADAMATLARRYAAEGMFDEAIHLYEMALKLRPASAALEVNLARVRERQKVAEQERYRSLAAELANEHDRNDMDSSQYVGLAQYHIEIGQTPKAIELLEIAKLRTPNSYRPYEILGRHYFATGEWELAEAEIRHARRMNPFDRSLAEISGRVYFELKRYDQALSDFINAFVLAPNRRGGEAEGVRRMINTLTRMLSLDNATLHARVREELNELALYAERLEFRKESLFQVETRGVMKDILHKISRDQEKRGTLIAISSELRKLGVFHHLRDEQILRLARFARQEHLDTGQYLFREGDRSMGFYVILAGVLEIRKETPVGAYIFARLGPDKIVGEMNFLDRQYRSTDGLAIAPVTCFSFAFSALNQIADEDREAAVALHWAFWKSLSEKVRNANEQIKGFFPDAPPRPAFMKSDPAERELVQLSSETKVSLFEERGLSAAEMRLLATFSSEERYRAPSAIFREGERGETLYIVVDGEVRISKFIPGAGEEALAILRRGDFFGEMALIDDEPRSADAWVHSADLTVLAIDRRTLREVLAMDPAASLQFLNLLCRLISRRLREIDDKLVQWKILSGGF